MTLQEFKTLKIEDKLNNLLKEKSIYKYDEILGKIDIKVSGVYIYFLIKQNKVLFAYIGESSNLKKRLSTHIRNFNFVFKNEYKNKRNLRHYIKANKIVKDNNLSVKDIQFAVLCTEEQENERLKEEAKNISYLWNKNDNLLNISRSSKKLKCDNGRGKIIFSHKEIDGKCYVIGRHFRKKICPCNYVLDVYN